MRDRLRKWFGLKCGGVESLCKISVVKQVQRIGLQSSF